MVVCFSIGTLEFLSNKRNGLGEGVERALVSMVNSKNTFSKKVIVSLRINTVCQLLLGRYTPWPTVTCSKCDEEKR